MIEDYRALSLSLKGHPVAFLRARLAAKGILRAERARTRRGAATRVTVAGLVLMRQRPGTAKGVIFMTIEDETGDRQYHRLAEDFRAAARARLGARLRRRAGELQSESGVIHLIAERMEDWTPTLGLLSEEGRSIATLSPADEVKRPQLPVSKKRQGNRFAQVQLFADPGGAVAAAPPRAARDGAETRAAGRAEFPLRRGRPCVL